MPRWIPSTLLLVSREHPLSKLRCPCYCLGGRRAQVLRTPRSGPVQRKLVALVRHILDRLWAMSWLKVTCLQPPSGPSGWLLKWGLFSIPSLPFQWASLCAIPSKLPTALCSTRRLSAMEAAKLDSRWLADVRRSESTVPHPSSPSRWTRASPSVCKPGMPTQDWSGPFSQAACMETE